MNYKIRVELKSDALIGSGEGFGAIIDTDVIFDDVGIPYIPGRRIKGCLRDSANEVYRMFEKSTISNFINLSKNGKDFAVINKVFGTPENPSCLNISNLTIEEYENSKTSLKRLFKDCPAILSKDEVVSFFAITRQQTKINDKGVADEHSLRTVTRQQTKINDKGVADEHSLRTVRAVKKGNVFEGGIFINNSDLDTLKLLWFACLNLRHLGTKRNRGFGEVECKLFDDNKPIEFEKDLEGVCR